MSDKHEFIPWKNEKSIMCRVSGCWAIKGDPIHNVEPDGPTQSFREQAITEVSRSTGYLDAQSTKRAIAKSDEECSWTHRLIRYAVQQRESVLALQAEVERLNKDQDEEPGPVQLIDYKERKHASELAASQATITKLREALSAIQFSVSPYHVCPNCLRRPHAYDCIIFAALAESLPQAKERS